MRVTQRYPLRCALLAATLVALTLIIWNAWPFGVPAVWLFILQAVSLAQLVISNPAKKSDREWKV